jgi:uncharacterized protein involved in type VI secretion and phage assembly
MSLNEYGFSMQRNDKRQKKRFYGKYRALVTNNNDSKDKMGRIKVICPAVLGDSESNWCNPCLPYGGNDIGQVFIPKVGDSVWVEFEEGDPDLPIWVGNWWGLNEMPSDVYKKVGYHHVIQTKKTKIYINDETGEITLQASKVTIDGDLKVTGNTL